jgi:hypothetical protein
MFESLESRQLFSVATVAPDPDQSTPVPVEQTVTVDGLRKSGGATSGQVFLVFTFKLVAVKTVSWQ